MQRIVREHPYTIAYLSLVGLAIIAASFQEIGSAMSGVIMQLNICRQGDSACLLVSWIVIITVLGVFSFLLDRIRRNKNQQLGSESIVLVPTIRTWNFGSEDKYFAEVNSAPYGWSGSDSDVGEFTDVKVDRKEGQNYDTLFIEVFNNPERINGIPTAVDVWSWVEWYSLDEKTLMREHSGRWWIPNPNLEKNKERLLYRDINANGDPQKLHFAIKAKTEKRFYGLCRDKGDRGIIRDDRYKLEDEQYIVKIKLTGSNIFQELKFRIERKGTKFSIMEALTDESKKHMQETVSDKSTPTELENLTLAQTGFIDYPQSKYHNVTIEEYVFTIVNETGQNLKKCFILLDEFWIKSDFQTDGKWKLDAVNMFDKPFRWRRENLLPDGKIDIDNGDRASFVLVQIHRSSILNVTKNEHEPHLDFRLAFLGEDGHSLYTGWENFLRIGILAQDVKGKSVLVRYSIYFQPHSFKGLEDIRIAREANDKKTQKPPQIKRKKRSPD